jgi:hypothetical protein
MSEATERAEAEPPFLYWPSDAEVDAAIAQRRAGGKQGGRGLVRRKLAAAVSAGIRSGRLSALVESEPPKPDKP